MCTYSACYARKYMSTLWLQKTLSVALALWAVAPTISIAQYVTDFSQRQTVSAKTAQQHHVQIPGKFARFVMDQWTSRIQYA